MFETLEEARAEITRLNRELEKVTRERDTLTGQNKKLGEDLEKVREINQQYFLELNQQYHPDPNPKDKTHEEEPPSCEDFAKTINI